MEKANLNDLVIHVKQVKRHDYPDSSIEILEVPGETKYYLEVFAKCLQCSVEEVIVAITNDYICRYLGVSPKET